MKTRIEGKRIVTARFGTAAVLLLAFAACGRMQENRQPRTQLSAPGKLEIVRQPSPADFHRPPAKSLPRYDATVRKSFQVDVRGVDLRAVDLGGRIDDLRHADFDSKTRWPEKLPAAFAPEKIIARNRNPGLGIRAVHARGITGRGVGIGIIDQTLLATHTEYRERLRSYEEIHEIGSSAQMHGPAVASIAVGRTVGVAPGADLYYIALVSANYDSGKMEIDRSFLAPAIDRLLEINRALPAARRIRVISISAGWNPRTKGGSEAAAAVARARQAGVFVITTSLSQTHHLSFQGLGRDPDSDPDAFESYRPGRFWADSFWNGGYRFGPGQHLLLPMDSRAVASPTGAEDYVYYSGGGLSWAVPWIAGLYALACEVRPNLTPDEFWVEALRTGRTIRISHGNETVEFGTLADPVALIERLQAI